MTSKRAILCLLFLCAAADPARPQPKKKRILAIGDVHRKAYQHDAVSHTLATIEQLGRKSGLFDTYIRTDIQLLTKHPIQFAENNAVPDANHRDVNYLTLNDFDAVVFYGIGELELSDQQKADLLSFVHDDGKGFVGVHTATTAFYNWPEYGEMTGGYFDDHPWLIFDAPVIVEDPKFPVMKAFAKTFRARDEVYQVKTFSRDRVRVLARLDPNKIDLANPRVHRTDKDFAVAWRRDYGEGRVFYSTFGHTEESWDDPRMQTMWLEAIKWATWITVADATPRPLR